MSATVWVNDVGSLRIKEGIINECLLRDAQVVWGTNNLQPILHLPLLLPYSWSAPSGTV